MAGPANPYLSGLAGRCPNCGEGMLFEGFLRISPACEACGYDLSEADSGDGPAVFIILIAGFLVCFTALFVEFTFHPPIWLHLILWLPLITFVSVGLLRPMKGLMVAAQVANKASEAGRRDV